MKFVLKPSRKQIASLYNRHTVRLLVFSFSFFLLRRFEAALGDEGFDTCEIFNHLSVEDMARLSMPPGVRCILDDAKTDLAVSSSQI